MWLVTNKNGFTHFYYMLQWEKKSELFSISFQHVFFSQHMIIWSQILHHLCVTSVMAFRVRSDTVFGGIVQLGGREYPLFSKLLFSYYYIHVYIYLHIKLHTHRQMWFLYCVLSFLPLFLMLFIIHLIFLSPPPFIGISIY